MAGDWIPMRVDLAEDPAVIAIATATGLDEFGVVGRLHKLWSWANAQSRNGHAVGVTKMWIDRVIGVTGFADAMIEAGWLECSEDEISFPKFSVWNEKSAKTRLLAARRQRNAREAKKSRKERDKSVTTEQNRITKKEGDDAPSGIWDLWKLIAGKNSGGILRKAINEYGEETVAAAVSSVALKRPADPVSYLYGVLKGKAKANRPPEVVV